MTPASLQALTYSGEVLAGEGPSNQLGEGAVFAVFNWDPSPVDDFDYAKVQVLVAGDTLKVQWEAYRLRPAYRVLGQGYEQPLDVVVTADGRRAYVTEGVGNLLAVDLANADRSEASVVAGGLIQPHQMAVDEARHQAYVMELNNLSSRLVRVDLASGAVVEVVGNLNNAVGLLLGGDAQTAYVTQQSGGPDSLCRVALVTGQREPLGVTMTRPASLAWAAGGESQILTTDLATNELVVVDLATSPPSARPVAGVPREPASAAGVAPGDVLVCCFDAIVRVQLTATVFTPDDDLLHGIGHVPKGRINNGYATTDPGYFFPVIHAPFGGTLPVMFNHERAHRGGARYYQVVVDGLVQRDTWSDDLWVPGLARNVLTPAPMVGPFFRVRAPGEPWYNRLLGYRLPTTTLADGPHTIEVRTFTTPDTASEIPGGRDQLSVVIDNQCPRAVIERIVHHQPSASDPASRRQEVGACGIVQGSSDEFTFAIQADDRVAQHLGGWSLDVVWGDNRSFHIDDHSYERGHVAGFPHRWAGVHGEVPATPWRASVPGDESSRRCAHTFVLRVWDRVIDGWSSIHVSNYTRSITLLLDPAPPA